MKAKYYDSPEQVLFNDPFIRFLAKIFGKKYFVTRCKKCNKIPTSTYDGYCEDHFFEELKK